MILSNFIKLLLKSTCRTPKLLIELSFPCMGVSAGHFISADITEILENEKFKEIIYFQVLSVGIYNGMIIITV